MIELKPHPKAPKIGRHTLDAMFEDFKQHGTTHSASAMTLPLIINRCEQEKIPYVLKAMPGAGYRIERMKLCSICKRELDVWDKLDTRDCGGDCLKCMAEAGDPDCIAAMSLINGEDNASV